MRTTSIALGLALCASAYAGTVDRVAAVVGDEVIALSEIYELGGSFITEACPAMRADCILDAEVDILDSLILRVLIRQELAQLGQDVTAEDLRRTLEDIVRDNSMANEEALRAAIEESGERWDVYKDEIREQLRQGRFQNWIIAPRIPVSEDELVDAYRRGAREIAAPDKVRFEAITIPVDTAAGAEALGDKVLFARDLYTRMKSGELSWEDASAEHHSGALGRVIPPVARGDMVGPLDTVVFATEPGDIGEPVVASGHVFIVRVIERVQAELPPFEEVRDTLAEQVRAQKGEVEIEQWYLQARRKAAVRVLLEEG